MSKILKAHEFCDMVAEATGINLTDVRSITINAQAGGAVILTVEKYIRDDAAKQMLTEWSDYALVKRTEPV